MWEKQIDSREASGGNWRQSVFWHPKGARVVCQGARQAALCGWFHGCPLPGLPLVFGRCLCVSPPDGEEAVCLANSMHPTLALSMHPRPVVCAPRECAPIGSADLDSCAPSPPAFVSAGKPLAMSEGKRAEWVRKCMSILKVGSSAAAVRRRLGKTCAVLAVACTAARCSRCLSPRPCLCTLRVTVSRP